MNDKPKYVIEKGIPMPLKRSPPGRPRDPESLLGRMAAMEKDDSIFVACPVGKNKNKHQTSMSGKGTVIRNTYNATAKFTTRLEGDGVRVWRIE